MKKPINKQSVEKKADEELVLAVDSMREKDYDKAAFYMQDSVKMLKSIDSTEKYVEYLNILGMIYDIEEDEKAAFDCYLESLATAEVIRSRELKAMIYSSIGSSYRKMGKDKEAVQYFEDAYYEYNCSSRKKKRNEKMWTIFEYINKIIYNSNIVPV